MLARSLKFTALAVALGVVSTAQADIFSYGDFAGSDFAFLNVTEGTGSVPNPLFGAPIVSGNTLLFSPLDFESASTGAGGVNITDGTLSTLIMATGSLGIQQIILEESGDYSLLGSGGAGTSATAAASWFINVIEVDGVAVNPISLDASTVFASVNLADNGSGIAVVWDGAVTIDIAALLAANNIVGDATKVTFNMDNTLATTSEAGTSALISKKDQGVKITVVPTPSALVVLGLMGITGSRRRRR